ncbi:MAG TPA: hypothetical protein VIY48_02280 [Candidatus Paceibacterota bacterium]|jgi:hypothetical protein
MYGPLEREDFAEEDRPIYDEIDAKRRRNVMKVNGLQQQGASIDFAVAKLEHTLVMFVHLGIITPKQYLEICTDWEDNFGNQLNLMMQQLREQLATPRKQLYVPGR